MSCFSVVYGDIEQKTPAECADIFGRMLRVEARTHGISGTNVIMSNNSDAPDGGIDARVKCEQRVDGNLITGVNPSYQIKAGKNFKPWQESHINNELFGCSTPSTNNLGKETRRCFENGYTYVLVCMKTDLNPSQHERALENIKIAVKRCGLPTPDVKIFGMQQVLDQLNCLPGLARSITGHDHPYVKTHHAWHNGDLEMQKDLCISDVQKNLIQKIQNELSDDSGSIHINLYGETGVGKTRLALEATKESHIADLVVYCNSPRLFYNEVRREVKEYTRAIFVIDDCFEYDMWDWIRQNTKNVKLVTISNEKQDIIHTSQIEIPPLSASDAESIILQYVGDVIVAKRLASWCGGIPRLAHILGGMARKHPDKILGYDDMNAVLERYVVNMSERGPVPPEQAKTVMLTLALFKKIGTGTYFKKEYAAAASLVQKIDNNLSLDAFEKVIRSLQNQKVLQGREVLYITPKALHVLLWAGWWDRYKNLTHIIDEITASPLAESFYDMINHASHSDMAKPIIRGLFGDDGPLQDRRNALKTDRGASLFYALAKADPHAALPYLEDVVGAWTKSQMQGLVKGARRSVIHSLERIMFEPDLFERGGKILRGLAEAENEEWSNNSTGIFCSMFSMGIGHLSGTRAPPHERLPLLKDTLCADNAARRSLGLGACRSALAVKHSSISSFGYDGMEFEHMGWEPAFSGQLQESYVAVLEMMLEKIARFSDFDAKRAASQIILDASRPLLHHMPDMGPHLVGVITNLRQAAGDEAVLKTVLEILEFDVHLLDSDTASNLECMIKGIEGSDYSSQMRQYVMADERVDMVVKRKERNRNAKIKQLAAESLADLGALRPHLPLLVTRDAGCGGEFGYELSVLDTDERALCDILDAQRGAGNDSGNGFFLSGYLRRIFERDVNRWNKVMQDIVAADTQLCRFFIEAACRSGITDEIGMLIATMVRDRRLLAGDLASMTPYFPNRPSAGVVYKWIELLMQDASAKSLKCALRMFHVLLAGKDSKEINANLALRLLAHDALFVDGGDHPALDSITAYNWQEIAVKLVNQNNKDATMSLCRTILENMSRDILRVWLTDVLDLIASRHPDEVWEVAVRYVGKPLDAYGLAILLWMRGDTAASQTNEFLKNVTHDLIFDWIKHDIAYRAPLMARHVPPVLEEGSIALKLAKRYGTDQMVLGNLSGNFMSCSFSGSAIDHYTRARKEILEYKKHTDDPGLHAWLDYHAKVLHARIEEAAVFERRLTAKLHATLGST